MPKIKHNAPGFGYRVFWKLDRPGQDWNSQEITDHADSKLIVRDQPTYQRYKVKVVAFNEIGESKAAQKTISGYSGEGGEYILSQISDKLLMHHPQVSSHVILKHVNLQIRPQVSVTH